MKRTITLCLLATLMAGCARESGKQQAALTFQHFERVNSDLYLITYTSDLDLLNVFDRTKGEGQLATMLVCSLDGDTLFSTDHVIEKTFEGVIGVQGKTPGPPYVFKTVGDLSFNSRDGSSYRYLEVGELRHLLGARQDVTCKASITVFGYKAYYSKPMLIPAQDIQREVEKPPRTWTKGAGEEYLPPEFRLRP